jgi:hypothetical protein
MSDEDIKNWLRENLEIRVQQSYNNSFWVGLAFKHETCFTDTYVYVPENKDE